MINTQTIQEKLNNNLKDIYPLAQKADEQLEQLKEEDKGRFAAIFQQDSGFEARANRFLPYLIELSEDIQALPELPEADLPKQLQKLVTKIQLMHKVLAQFHTIT